MSLVNPSTPSPLAAPSDWVLRWARDWRAGASVLDLACGSGRHLRPLAQAGLRLCGVDRDGEALAGLAAWSATAALPAGVELLEADIEQGPWPLQDRGFDAVVVTNYLWRPLLPRVVSAVAPGGWLIYETFTDGQQSIGRPSRPDFLLRPGELLEVVRGLRVVAYEDGFIETPGPSAPDGGVNGRYVQRVAAVRENPSPGSAPDGPPGGVFPRYRLR
ncbi:class I SAM-dependent methyltransferase [Roseateles chitosanitabidus]|jgi:SAM-dependent methyltransferase|uniref:class I SAM-dependent methyltransferase n=1 Tax=Roseateles chitosanitabidus TaxID=65048 RepID=UPI000836648F|nr:class I SAM-dependent methyltransferase [Roseateles chitosanitabidus]MBO9686219.1 class I SAM-dependent methyltransferase [Roseateles chitosanitabidus]